MIFSAISKKTTLYFFFIFPFLLSTLFGSDFSFSYDPLLKQVPYVSQGRIRPLNPSVELWISNLSHFSEQLENGLNAPTDIPSSQFLSTIDDPFLLLPGRYDSGIWFSLKALEVRVIDPRTKSSQEIGNFTLYSDEQFSRIRAAYKALKEAVANPTKDAQIQFLSKELASELISAYTSISGQIYREASGKSLHYPTLAQISLELWYTRYPLTEAAILLYLTTAILLAFNFRRKKSGSYAVALTCLFSAFAIHSLILGMRCAILQRPPVSNMFETVIYVPWVAVFSSIILRFILSQDILLFASSIGSALLLFLLKITNLNSSLENVQAVLDSHYWLIIHVLMVVGSYGIFILSGILGHLYLAIGIGNKSETSQMRKIGKLILQTMYLGIALLIPGTILGGVWAAESWGRFWDWDPKESWAFISSCVYLIWIHAFTFGYIHYFGLAIGSITGLLAMSFTWYGVNYILGTGLHSYGFGSGGEIYYYFFLIFEILFLSIALFEFQRRPTSGVEKFDKKEV